MINAVLHPRGQRENIVDSAVSGDTSTINDLSHVSVYVITSGRREEYLRGSVIRDTEDNNGIHGHTQHR